MWLIALKGLSASGKSTLGRALSKQLGWPLIDKDDVKDLLDGYTAEAGGLAYDIMFNIARGINCCQICRTNLDSSRSRRPESVQRSQRSFRIPGCYRLRSCPSERAGWSVPLLDQR
jgi:hypothetical protein